MKILLLSLLLLVGCRLDQYVAGEPRYVTLEMGDAVVEVSATVVDIGGRWESVYVFFFTVDGFSPDSIVCQVVLLELGSALEFAEVVVVDSTYEEFWSKVEFDPSRLPDMGWSARLVRQ